MLLITRAGEGPNPGPQQFQRACVLLAVMPRAEADSGRA